MENNKFLELLSDPEFMKKLVAIVSAIMLMVSLGACQKALSPTEKLEKFIMANGTQAGEQYVLESQEAVKKIEACDFTIAHMENLKATGKTEFKVMQGADGISLELLDSSITDNGLKMERTVTIAPDGTFQYYNGIIMNGVDMGVRLKGEIPVATYSKENVPVITESELATGAKLTDAVKDTLKDYIDLTLDCYAVVLAQEELGMTMADVGYTGYLGNE